MLLVAVSSDKGLCGSLNTEIFRECHALINQKKSEGIAVDIITVGKKARNHFARISGINMIADFESLGDTVEYLETSPIGQLIIDEFGKGEYAEVVVGYKKFESIVQQIAEIKTILPLVAIEKSDDEGAARHLSAVKNLYEFEPDPERVLSMILPQLVKMNIFQTMLENNASEHASRMVAMKNATDAGSEIVEDLEFTYNRLRQERITSEISEIAAGAEALAG